MSWDYLIVTQPYASDIKSQVVNMMYQGRISTSTAIFLQLLTWQDAQFACPYMSLSEIQEVRQHPLGSPSFCLGPIGKTIWLKGYTTGKYVSADLGRGTYAPLVAERSQKFDWEKFRWSYITP